MGRNSFTIAGVGFVSEFENGKIIASGELPRTNLVVRESLRLAGISLLMDAVRLLAEVTRVGRVVDHTADGAGVFSNHTERLVATDKA